MDKKNVMENFIKAVNDFSESLYKYITICIANPNTLLKLDMNNFGINIWFLSDITMEEDKIMEVVSGKLKRELYKFCEEHPDRCFKGTRF